MIEQLKNNKVAFGLMPVEMQEKAMEIGKKGNFLYFSGSAWQGTEHADVGFNTMYTYRLKSDYEEKGYVDIEINKNETSKELTFIDEFDQSQGIDLAIRNVNFIGFIYEIGEELTEPISTSIIYIHKRPDNIEDFLLLIHNEYIIPLRPKYVRFKKD